MRLSAPVFILEPQACALSREQGIPLHRALDRIAMREGFNAWRPLATKAASDRPVATLLAQLCPGELVLLGARPRQGKTLMGLELAPSSSGRRGASRALLFSCVSGWSQTPHTPGLHVHGVEVRGGHDRTASAARKVIAAQR